MATIAIDGVSKRFGDVVAVDDLSLSVESGEVFGFLGPNGAGKSTTINMVLDFVKPTSGSISVLGMDAQRESKQIRKRIGVLPEGYQTYDRLTGYQHLEFAIRSKGVNDDPDALLDRVGLDPADADRKAGGYSKGMAQRLLLAMALVGDPDLLILDEPTTGLDPNGAREMRELVLEEANRGATVFFSSHILEQVEAVCDRVGIVREGQLVAEDTIEGLRDSVGGGETLRIELDRATDEAVQTAQRVDGVTSASIDRDASTSALVVSTSGSKTAILSALEDEGFVVEDFSTEEASLEEVFHAYTTDKAEVTA
ncbi:ABC-type multidrug transport system, ATPase component [Halovivax ruber XH-70]|uniref:ABC-type multidrug transport system, ATPase component n=1 Tax=Halovivax ruber (strain DSM 18193 / JCM 13892 / XH-70) TaxID=797302 RepID=L0I5Q3_HALRX|nr:ABC transporter ATP-binding protein [Halovivax ruber]AGB14840.1 ABC-type multidrug transport system, ATPase component [Halovivax ruber XH-70]